MSYLVLVQGLRPPSEDADESAEQDESTGAGSQAAVAAVPAADESNETEEPHEPEPMDVKSMFQKARKSQMGWSIPLGKKG